MSTLDGPTHPRDMALGKPPDLTRHCLLWPRWRLSALAAQATSPWRSSPPAGATRRVTPVSSSEKEVQERLCFGRMSGLKAPAKEGL